MAIATLKIFEVLWLLFNSFCSSILTLKNDLSTKHLKEPSTTKVELRLEHTMLFLLQVAYDSDRIVGECWSFELVGA